LREEKDRSFAPGATYRWNYIKGTEDLSRLDGLAGIKISPKINESLSFFPFPPWGGEWRGARRGEGGGGPRGSW